MTMRRPLIATMCAGLVLFASCKGDEGGDEGASGSDTTSPGSDSGTDPTIDPSAEETMDPTVNPDSSGSMSAEDTIDPTNDPDSTGVQPGERMAFRFNSIAVRDPHFFAPIVGDVTDSNVNIPLTEALNTDGADGMPPPDGFLDLGLVLLFDPLDQADGGGGDFQFANAQCTAPVDTTTCDLFPGTDLFSSTYTNNTAGPCLTPDPTEVTVYPDPPTGPLPTPGPCFDSAPTAVVLQTMSFSLPLTDAVVSATYVGDPAGNLVTGNIQGFLTTADAESTQVDVPPLGMMPIANLLHDEDKDGDGWRMHVSFTAETVEWTGA